MNETSFKMTTFSCPKCDFEIQVCRCKIVPVTYVFIDHLSTI